MLGSSVVQFGGSIGTRAAFLSLMGIALFFKGLFSLFVGRGLLNGKEWAWALGVTLEILGIMGGIIILTIAPLFGLIILLPSGLMLYYLFRPNVKAWFQGSKGVSLAMQTKRQCVGCGQELPVEAVYCPECGQKQPTAPELYKKLRFPAK